MVAVLGVVCCSGWKDAGIGERLGGGYVGVLHFGVKEENYYGIFVL
jgi:hypothetical protein